jgi:hypothetical protein
MLVDTTWKRFLTLAQYEKGVAIKAVYSRVEDVHTIFRGNSWKCEGWNV